MPNQDPMYAITLQSKINRMILATNNQAREPFLLWNAYNKTPIGASKRTNTLYNIDSSKLRNLASTIVHQKMPKASIMLENAPYILWKEASIYGFTSINPTKNKTDNINTKGALNVDKNTFFNDIAFLSDLTPP